MGWLSNLLRRPAPEATLVTAGTRIELSEPVDRIEVLEPVAPETPTEGPLWPPVLEGKSGRPAAGAGLDRMYYDTGILVFTGWCAGAGSLALEGDQGIVEPDVSVLVARPDVAAAYGFADAPRGMLLAFREPPQGARIVARAGGLVRANEASGFPPQRLEADLARILSEYAPIRGQLFELVRDYPKHLAAVARSASHSNRPGVPHGHMEILKSVPGAGGLCIGWTLGPGPFFLVDEHGTCQPLDAPLRWTRQDIFDGFSADYGANCADAGFLQALPASTGAHVRLLARDGDDLVLLHERNVERAPRDAVGYARWSFALPAPLELKVDHFARHYGPTLRTLIGRTSRPPEPEVRRAGHLPTEPEVTLVIPLYGRYDFVEHQLLEFADDPFIRHRCEVIYVVDDPAICTRVFTALDTWWQLYDLPLTVAWGGRNRGFSGASNLGLSLARGRHVLFLNSDVIPIKPGWLEQLSHRFDTHPEYGLLGVRLLYPSGGLQHDGMIFRHVSAFGVWMNDHPGKGMLPLETEPGAVVEWPAATGACLIGDRAKIAELGGFSEEYLIGDFEDSDLCMKVRSIGLNVGVCPDIALTHLERQSFGFQGAGDFRLRVTLFNAWLHQERWGSAIERLAAERDKEMPA